MLLFPCYELNSKDFPIPSIVKDEWDKWNILGTVLVSLLLQTLLIFIAPLRKRTEKRIITLFIWAAYLLANWVAAFAVGLIFSAQGNDNCKELVNKDIAVFWAPFLLLHLGGPDNVTAFALEDNELWLRHLLSLLFQLVTVAYVFLQSVHNEFWIPTLLMFVAGTIKYAERTCALYLACLGNFRASMLPKPDAGIDYPRLMEEYSLYKEAHIPVKIVIGKEVEKRYRALDAQSSINKIGEIEVVNAAYKFFKIFKGLIVDLASSLDDRQESRAFMLERCPQDALRVMELELNFLYDVLYTKMPVVHCKRGFFFRLVCSVLIVISFQRFASHHKQHLHHLDIAVTYTLLIGALGLDLVAFVMFIFSDWTIALLKNSKMMSIVYSIRKKLSLVERQRWSNSVSRHSFIKYCVEEQHLNWFDKPGLIFGLNGLLVEMRYIKRTKLTKCKLMEFIFNELKYKALKAEDPKVAKKMCSARGGWVLSQSFITFNYPISSTVSEEIEYDESLLLWHIATELCYFKDDDGIADQKTNRKFCKILSDYMLYLIVMQPTIMSALAGTSLFRFRDTCEEAKKFFAEKELTLKSLSIYENFKFFDGQSKKSMKDQKKKACKELLDVDTVVRPAKMKGEVSRSLLFDACMLAKDLRELGRNRMWEIMSKVWVELLCYAASHCKPNAYAQHLSKGGELITFVWLLMAHFGLREEFRKDIPNSKLIVAK
ncbi:hypothetical protein LOK49_LG06G00649 [Camellia lanceoleosa]|uniref:Uncharacterized protein n=1 Tax=Camellia lanceoleosa TaxID=1840588 RepID=A0ACC0HGN9_9ERIC|nr:hypothetical protein LOK49_LG06G00649 [Camellia lanceoleosa]